MKNWKEYLVGLITISLFVGIMSRDPISQSLIYHNFADQRMFLGIPNFFDVISNLIFIVIGFLGINFSFKNNLSAAYKVFFIGVFLVGPGSAYYHWAPDNARLVWDRLPMTVGFMGLFSALMGSYINPKLEKILLVPLVLLGLSSVVYWAAYDDLRFYAFIQAAPLAVIPCLFFLYRDVKFEQKYLLFALISYGLAKLTESKDSLIYDHFFHSGHTIKHLLAGVGSIFIYRMLKKFNEKEKAQQT